MIFKVPTELCNMINNMTVLSHVCRMCVYTSVFVYMYVLLSKTCIPDSYFKAKQSN